MEKLVDLYEGALRSATSTAPHQQSKCISALSRLRRFPVSVTLLTDLMPSIDLLKGLGSLANHPNPDISQLSSLVVATWRTKLLKEFAKCEKAALDARKKKANPLKIIIKLPKSKLPNPDHDHPPQNLQNSDKATAPHQKPSLKAALDAKKKANPRNIVINHPKSKFPDPDRPQNLQNTNASLIRNDEEAAPHQKPTSAPPKKRKLFHDPKPQLKADYALPKNANLPSRDNIREQIYQALSMVFQESQDDADVMDQLKTCDAIRIAASLESALFHEWRISEVSCRAKYRSLLFNIKDAKNPDFRRKILLGKIKPEAVAEMNASDMASDEMLHKNNAIVARSLWKCTVDRNLEATTDQFRCGKCGESKTTYHQMQTRSADEPMTTYVTCTVCDNRWKFC